MRFALVLGVSSVLWCRRKRGDRLEVDRWAGPIVSNGPDLSRIGAGAGAGVAVGCSKAPAIFASLTPRQLRPTECLYCRARGRLSVYEIVGKGRGGAVRWVMLMEFGMLGHIKLTETALPPGAAQGPARRWGSGAAH